jgi:aminobenzoyl-glutamate transport protein
MRRSSKNLLQWFLVVVEKGGNALPHPSALFAICALAVILLSGLLSALNVQAIHPGTGQVITVFNLLSKEGFHMMITKMVTNFTGFAPLGTVLVALMGIGIAEYTGLISSLIRKVIIKAPKNWITAVVVFLGILSNTASEVGYVVLVPLAAVIFHSVGKHPIAGLAAAFAGVSGGYSANLLLGTVDPLLAGLTQEAARIIHPGYEVNPACNYYFMFVSTFLLTILGTWVTERIIIPRLGPYQGQAVAEEIKPLSKEENRGLRYAGITTGIIVILILWGLLPEEGFLRDLKDPSLLKSPFLSGIVAFLFLAAALISIAYGIGAGKIRNEKDVVAGMDNTMRTLGGYIVLVFFASQFVAYFGWTNLGLILAVKGASLLKAMQAGTLTLLIGLILFSAFINLFMGSASAKWAIMAPVFVPMFMLLGYSPELTQGCYRIGDSVTNIISPMMSYFALIISFIERYEKKSGIGTLVATMLPYSVVFLIGWSLLFLGWISLDLPVGPGASLYYKP